MIATFHDLKDISVFITGGGNGIGAAITEGFIEQGARVAFVQRSDAGEFCDEMEKKYKRRPLFMACDVTDKDRLKACIDQASEMHGAVTALVNNAANDKRHRTEEVDDVFWDWSMAINLKSYFFGCQAVIPHMRQAGHGTIVNITSISYMMGNEGYPVYTTANSGLNGMTRSLAREFGRDKIRVNALAPGWTLTQKQKDLWATPEALSAQMERQCLKEHLAPRDIVDAVLFLTSQTSRMMSGQSLVIDGGVAVTG